MERYFQISDQFLDLCRVRRQRSGDVCVASRRSNLLHCRGGDVCGVIGVSVDWAHESSPFVRMCRNLTSVSERNVMVHNFAGASVGRLVLILVAGRTLMVAAAVFLRTKQQVAGDDFSAVFPLAALPILPACRLEIAFDVHLGTFGNVLSNDLCQTLPGHDVVPLGPLLPLVVSVFEPFVGSDAEVGDRSAALRISDLRVFANVSNEDDFVYALWHFVTSDLRT